MYIFLHCYSQLSAGSRHVFVYLFCLCTASRDNLCIAVEGQRFVEAVTRVKPRVSSERKRDVKSNDKFMPLGSITPMSSASVVWPI